MDLLRRRQVAEILDEDRRINDRVFSRELEQVKEFDEVVRPKTGKDIDTEVKFDREIERMNSVLTAKLNAIENIFKPLGKSNEATARNQEIVLNTSDIISTFNNLARAVNSPTIANDTREALKAKIQEISPNVNALLYGYKQLSVKVNRPGEQNESVRARLVPRLITGYATVSVLQKQLFKDVYAPITSSELDVAYKNTVADLAPTTREYLAGIEGQADLRLRPLAAGSERRMLQQRLRQLEAERGEPLSPEEIARVRNTLFGVREYRADPDPAVAEELHRQDQQALEDREAANAVVAELPNPIIPVPRRSDLGEELRRGIIQQGEASAREKLERMGGILDTYAEKYRRNAPDDIPGDVMAADIQQLLGAFHASLVENTRSRGQEVDPEELRDNIRAAYPYLLRDNLRGSATRRSQFFASLSKLISEYAEQYAEVVRREADRNIEAGLNQPVIGEGKPHHGLQYEEEKQEMQPSPLSRINEEERPDPSFFKRNHTKAHRRL